MQEADENALTLLSNAAPRQGEIIGAEIAQYSGDLRLVVRVQNSSIGDTEKCIAGGRNRHTADIMAEKKLACLVAEFRPHWPAGRFNCGRVGGN